jgi:pimeloyl-ACP methyl ester carboxylesterase
VDAQVTSPVERRIPAGEVELAVRDWPGEGQAFVLVHGLASNALTWDGVGRCLNDAGHRVISVDQRGHGHSDKPDTGYGFDEVTADLKALIAALELERPIVAGQSWGGNVVLEFAARHPDETSGIVLVDGGFIDLSSRPGATWESISQQLRPPNLLGTPRALMLERFRSFHATWDNEQIEMQMGNYETLEDGTIRPWLTLDHHMEILRALWNQRPSQLCANVTVPVLIAAADPQDEERRLRRDEELAKLTPRIKSVEVKHFTGAPHDIHVDRPAELADWILDALQRGFFGERTASTTLSG